MTKERKIELVPAPEKSAHGDWNLYVGRKAVMVDGVLYGYALYRAAGRNGAFYTFEQAGGETITERRLFGPKKIERFPQLEVWSDKTAQHREDHEARSAKRPIVRIAPLATRLLAVATKLVEDGRLISIEAQNKLVADRRKAMDDAASRAEARKAAAWRKRALACLPARGSTMSELLETDAADKIVAAMKWAQVQ